MISVRLYANTGFNACNIPLNPSDLDTMQNITKYDCPLLDLIQTKGMGKLSVKWRVENNTVYPLPIDSVDYIRLQGVGGENPYTVQSNTVYYIVNGAKRTSSDVVEFDIVEDFISTLGGLGRINFSDGIIERETPSSNVWEDDIIDDELLGCARPLDIEYEWLGAGDYSYMAGQTLIESTLDLTGSGINYKRIDDTSGGSTQSVLIPIMDESTRGTTYKSESGDYEVSKGANPSLQLQNPTGASLYASYETNVLKNIANARSLGIENGILNQYVIPSNMVTVVIDPSTGCTITGKKEEFSTNLEFLPSGFNSDNMYYRIYQGANAKYGLMTCTGDCIEFNPEDISQDTQNQRMSTPVVVRFTDPRAEGKPYYQSKFFHGSLTPMLSNAVAGAKWAKAPLKFTQVSGVEVFEQQFKNTSQLSQRQYAGTQAQLQNALSAARFTEGLQSVAGIAGLAGKGAGAIGQAYAGATLPGSTSQGTLASLQGSAGGFMQSAGEYFRNMTLMMAATNAAEIAQSTGMGVYQFERQKEMYNFGVTAYTQAPQISFPADINTLRDIQRNGVLIYKYNPNHEDALRQKAILDMYGLRTHKPANSFNPSNGVNWYYVQIKGAQISGDKGTGYSALTSAWERDGASAQLSAGIRAWKVKPNPSLYTRNKTNLVV